MNVNICLMVAGIVLLDAIIHTEGQNCSKYTTISNSRRSAGNVFNGATDSPISDTYIDTTKWYRFRSYVGDTIPERAEGTGVDFNHCGTNNPIYIRGQKQHPVEDNQSKSVTVELINNLWKDNITIHKCPADKENESFYIYHLVSAPADQTAYCAGEDVPCPKGYMYNGFECVDHFPLVTGPPIFSGPNITIDNNGWQQIYFKCQVPYTRETNDDFARFIITFIFDGLENDTIGWPHKHLPSFELGPSDDISVNLTEYYLQGRLGKKIRCKVNSFWDENSEKDIRISEYGFKATLEAVEIFDFDFKNGSDQNITFTPTVPFTYYHCSTNNQSSCHPPLTYIFNVNSTVALLDCSIKWVNGTLPTLEVHIKPFDGSRTFEVKFLPYTGDLSQNRSSLWHNFIVPTVTIRAFNSSDKVCYSSSDPHITTFDGQYFNNYYNGVFNLVFAHVDQHKLEVQVLQETCNGNVACNCAVIVREKNSVVKIGYDLCGEWDSTTARPIFVTVLLKQYPYDGTNITTDDGGRKFSIRMPSGTRVEVDASIPWFSIQVHLHPIYQGKTYYNSSCGNSNGIKEDDSIDPNNSRIPFNESYFNLQPNCSEYFFPPAKSCICGRSNDVAVCTNTETNIAMKSPANNEIPTVWSSGVVCVDPGSSLLAQHSSGGNNADYVLDPADLFPPFVMDTNAGHNLNLSWPTPKGKSKEEVEEYCLKMLTGSPVYGDCYTVANTDMIILQCVSDIQIADEYIATSSYTDSFGQECVNVLIAQEAAGGTPPAINVSAIYSQICPAQCSGNGTCTNAKCICNEGYIGADCSIDETKPPVLTGIARSGICDIQQRPCATVSVFGYGLVSSKTLKCRFSTMGGDSATEINGTFVTGSEISCSVPSIAAERPAITRQGISVANDGTLYSNVLEFLTFDSVCMSCGQDKVCTQKTDACLISDRCYANGAMKDTETCQQCIPSQSTSSWIEKPVADRLQPCSRTCDCGAQMKETVCTANDEVVKAEPLLCQESSCAAIPEENLQGVVMIVSNEDIAKILLTPTDILSEVAEVVNNYCSVHATQCCNSVGVPNGVSLSSFTSLELCPYGSGYPQVGDMSSRIKVIVKMIPSQVQNECVQGAPQRSTDGEEAYADPDIIVTAVNEGRDLIEKALNITIMSVEKDDGSHSGAGFPVAKHTLPLVTTVTAFAMTRLF